MKSPWLFLTLAVSVCPLSSSVMAQEREQKAQGQIQLGLHKYSMKTGFLYEFEVAGEGFRPGVQLSGGGQLHASPLRTPGVRDMNTFAGVFIPAENAERTLIVLPQFMVGGLANPGALKYTITMKPMKLDEKPLLTKDDKITTDDPLYVDMRIPNRRGTHCKSYDVNLKANQTCVIEMTSKTAPRLGGRLYPSVVVEADAKQLAQGSSGGGDSAVAIFRAASAGAYRIIATGLSQNVDQGDFTLTVRTIKSE